MVDFIAPVFINFPVFNFADCLITVGLVLFIIWVARYCLEIKRLEAQEKTAGGAETQAAESGGEAG